MAQNFLQIRQDATARAGGSTGTVDADYPMLKTWINQRYHDINTKMKWKWTEKKYDGTTSANIQSVSFSTIDTNYREIKDIRLTDQSYARKLEFVDEQLLDQYRPYQTGSTTGTPLSYYIWAGSIYFYPIPDQSYNYEVRYYANDSDLQNDTDVPNLPVEAVQILAAHGYSMILKSKYIFDQALAIDKDIDMRIQRLIEEELERQADRNEEVFPKERPYNY